MSSEPKGRLRVSTSSGESFEVLIDYSDEDGCYVARVPALKYCTAIGDTYEEAAREIQDAIKGWLETAAAHMKTP